MSTAPNPPGTFVAPGATQETTGKKRASRIPLDYFKKGTWLDAWKWRISILCALVAVGYIVYTFLPAGEESYSRGPLTHHHANLKCADCHDGLINNAKGVFNAKATGKVNNDKCIVCHAGPEHHPGMKDALVVGCGACHQEHRGPDASLVRLPNSECTSCHRNLSESMTERDKTLPGHRTYENAITDFANHPEFKLPAKNPRTIKFDHSQHMNAGLVASPDAVESAKLTFAKLTERTHNDKATVDRYKAMQEKQGHGPTDPKNLVQLSCSSCHQLDAGDVGFAAGERSYEHPGNVTEAVLEPRGQGTYFKPVVYEIACKACHHLAFDEKLTDDNKKVISAPHRVQPPEVKRFIEGAYLRELLKPGKSDVFADNERPATRPLPGKIPPGDEKLLRDANDKAVASFNSLKENRCAQCHTLNGDEILPTNIPQVWQPHARFSHSSHRAMDCKSCHPKAYPASPDAKGNADSAKINTELDLPKIDNCRECHGPQKTVNGHVQGGFRSDCTECHSYHHGTMPLLGPGSAVYDPEKKMDVRKFLDLDRK